MIVACHEKGAGFSVWGCPQPPVAGGVAFREPTAGLMQESRDGRHLLCCFARLAHLHVHLCAAQRNNACKRRAAPLAEGVIEVMVRAGPARIAPGDAQLLGWVGVTVAHRFCPIYSAHTPRRRYSCF